MATAILPKASTASPAQVPADASTDLVSFKINLDGKDMSHQLSVVSIYVNRELNRIAEAEIVLVDGDLAKEKFPLSNKADFLVGKEVEIQAGYHGKDKTVFKGVIVKHGIKIIPDEGTYLTLTLKHKAFILTTSRKSAAFKDKKDSEIIEDIISKAGLKKSVDATKTQHRHMVQYNCSDWDFINMRAEQNGMYVMTGDKELLIKKPDTGQKPALELQFGSSIIEFDAEMDGRDAFDELETGSWNPADQKIKTSQPDLRGLKEQGNVSASDLSSKLKNKKSLRQHAGFMPDNERIAWANAMLIKSKLSKIRGMVKCIGFAGIQPGDMLKLNKTGERFSGTAFVSGVRHDIHDGLWETTIQMGWNPQWYAETYSNISAPPAEGLLPGVHGLQTGIVAKLEGDPDNEFRVQVKLPAISEKEEAAWARMATLDAGKERGSFWRPEIGDEVIVGFLNDDPRNAIILGCLHSSKLASPIKPSDKNHEKGIFTREKMKFLFNDEKKSISIETPKGNRIIISEDAKGITVEDENKNKITLNDKGMVMDCAKDLVIKAGKGKISISAAKDIEIKSSSGNLKLDGASGVKLNSNATTEIKGSLVKIN